MPRGSICFDHLASKCSTELRQSRASRFLTLRVLWPVYERPDSGRLRCSGRYGCSGQVGGVQSLDGSSPGGPTNSEKATDFGQWLFNFASANSSLSCSSPSKLPNSSSMSIPHKDCAIAYLSRSISCNSTHQPHPVFLILNFL